MTTFRKAQRALTTEERELADRIKELAEDLHGIVDILPTSRERDIAKERLEECVMWAVKAISR